MPGVVSDYVEQQKWEAFERAEAEEEEKAREGVWIANEKEETETESPRETYRMKVA